MIGYLEMDSGHKILWTHRIECELQAIYLQCFPPTRYVSGRGYVHTNATTFTRFSRNCNRECLLMALLRMYLPCTLIPRHHSQLCSAAHALKSLLFSEQHSL